MSFWKWLKGIAGVKPCETITELRNYIKVGDITGLQYWVSQVIWYEKDHNPSEEWEPVVKVLKKKKSDCEEKALIPFMVISSWPKWSARLLAVYGADYRGHAVCAFERPDGFRGYCDDSGVHISGRCQWERIAYDVYLSQPKKWAAWHGPKGEILARWDL